MNIGFLIPLSLGMGLAGLAAFFWALRHDQFADPEGDAHRILTVEPPKPRTTPPKEGDHHVRMVAKPDHPDPRRGL